MAREPRRFTAEPAKRTATPLFVGLFGPSSSGKTYSALELATGIQSVVGGDIAFIDTENRRALHYADDFKFHHIDFQPPFGSLDYRDAIIAAEQQFKAKTIIVDSMSHEHEGPGGMLETHEAVVRRMATWNGVFDAKKAERVKMLAWNEPKQARRALLNTLVRSGANVICCWRAKHTSKPGKEKDDSGREKNVVIDMGYTPIGGEDFVFEMTVAALLLPGAQGVPTWNPERPGEKMMVKLTKDHAWLRDIAAKGKPLDRRIGAGLARWAQGSVAPKAEERQEPAETRAEEPGPSGHDEPDRSPAPTGGDESGNFDNDRRFDTDGYEGV